MRQGHGEGYVTSVWSKGMEQGNGACACGKDMRQEHGAREWGRGIGTYAWGKSMG